jgi:hypothetical protein
MGAQSMATNTARLGLRKPEGADTVQVALDVSGNMEKLDAVVSAVCTSTTRPSTPFVGMRAFETDTGAVVVCTSTGPSVWKYISLVTCTSGTRPTNGLSIGTMIFETDTTNVLVLDQVSPARWRNIKTTLMNVSNLGTEITSPVFNQIVHHHLTGRLVRYDGSEFKSFLPSGMMFTPVKRNVLDGVTSTQLMYESSANPSTKPYLTTNWYRAVWAFNVSASAGGPPNGTVRIHLSAEDGAVSTASTVIAETNVLNQGGTNPRTHLETVFDVGSDGVYTVGCSATSGGAITMNIQASGGSGNAGKGRIFYVEDLGMK